VSTNKVYGRSSFKRPIGYNRTSINIYTTNHGVKKNLFEKTKEYIICLT
jgi:hypothetical protein